MTEKKVVKAVKKTAAKPKVEKVEQEQAAQETKKTVRRKISDIDRSELVPCRSLVEGLLVYKSARTGMRYVWEEFGSVEFIEYGELVTMRSSSPRFLRDCWIAVEDEDVAEALGLAKEYASASEVMDLDSFFDKKASELEEVVPNLPKGIKDTIATKARKMVEDGSLDSRNKIRVLEEGLNVELKMFEK